MIGLGTSLGVRDYQLFFPIPTGRARQIEPRSPAGVRGPDPADPDPVPGRRSQYPPDVRPAVPPYCGRDWASETRPGAGAALPVSPTAGFCQRRCDPLPVPAGECRECADTLRFLKSGTTPRSLLHSATLAAHRENAGSAGTRPPAAGAGPGHTGGGCNLPALVRRACNAGDAQRARCCGEDPWCPYEPGGCHRERDLPAGRDRSCHPRCPAGRPPARLPALGGDCHRLGIAETGHRSPGWRSWPEAGIIRGISPVLESRPLGLHAATLVALRVPEETA